MATFGLNVAMFYYKTTIIMVWFPQHPRRFMHAMQQVHIQPEPSQFDAPKRIYRRCQKRSEGVHHINTLPESRPRETARLRAMQPATPAGEDACMAYRRRICARLGLIPLRVSHTDSNFKPMHPRDSPGDLAGSKWFASLNPTDHFFA